MNKTFTPDYAVIRGQTAMTVMVDQAFKKADGVNYEKDKADAATSILLDMFRAAAERNRLLEALQIISAGGHAEDMRDIARAALAKAKQ